MTPEIQDVRERIINLLQVCQCRELELIYQFTKGLAGNEERSIRK